jgi:hypothetical protein
MAVGVTPKLWEMADKLKVLEDLGSGTGGSMTGAIYLDPNERPVWLQYPHSFCRLVDQQLIHITPWHILEGRQALARFLGLAVRYPTRELFPFAYRQDNDDVGCWAKGRGEKVFIIHDFASPGWEDEGTYDDVWAWFRAALKKPLCGNRGTAL